MKYITTADTNSQELVTIAGEILALLQAGLKPTIREVLESVLDTPEKLRAYHFSDGRKSRDVEESSGISYSSVTNLWKTWFGHGLGKMVSARGGRRFVRTLSLDEFGLELPNPQ